MAAKKKRTFEEQLSALETLIAQMESGGLSLEESMKRYEEGVGMVAAMEAELKEAIKSENYERAAELRDSLRELRNA